MLHAGGCRPPEGGGGPVGRAGSRGARSSTRAQTASAERTRKDLPAAHPRVEDAAQAAWAPTPPVSTRSSLPGSYDPATDRVATPTAFDWTGPRLAPPSPPVARTATVTIDNDVEPALVAGNGKHGTAGSPARPSLLWFRRRHRSRDRPRRHALPRRLRRRGRGRLDIPVPAPDGRRAATRTGLQDVRRRRCCVSPSARDSASRSLRRPPRSSALP